MIYLPTLSSEHESAHNVKVKSYLIIYISVLTTVKVISEFLYLRWKKEGIYRAKCPAASNLPLNR